MKKDLKAILKLAKVSFTGSRLAYEIGLEEGYQIGYADGLAEGKAEGVRVWAEMAAANKKAKV